MIAEHLPGEPLRPRPTAPTLLLRVALKLVVLVMSAMFTLGLWPIYGLSLLIWGRPPITPRIPQIGRFLRMTWTLTPPPPGLPLLFRVWITLLILQKVVMIPVGALLWHLDELLYGRQMDAVKVVAPLFEISAGRSGSTQLARYLEEDPQLSAPSFLATIFPYLWLWRAAPAVLGRFISADDVQRWFDGMLPPEFKQRHEGDPLRTDTFEGGIYMAHLNHLAPLLGPEALKSDFAFVPVLDHNRALWEEDFVALVDRMARKTLIFAGPGPDGPRRFFIKGHFLGAADALERRFPDARFLTMVREPTARLQSAVNYLRANPFDDVLGPVPWAWWSGIGEGEAIYCHTEQAWFTRPGGAVRCVVRFSDYVRDLEGTMAKVYRECLDTPELPAHVPRAHPPRNRTDYLLNRSLAQVGVDEAAVRAELSTYITWCG